ncbi:LURP-one-related/scramblase family protein [Caproicibacter sp.]|uniref:LURP-one-related/scramblase family protein n=1 Tax=Caproicibacter sp. TaxID=2814884 RepID=UPI00398A44DF
MQFYIKPVGGAHCLFTILNSKGQPVYEVTGRTTPFGNRFFLLDGAHDVVGRISAVRISGAAQYSAAAGGEKIHVVINGFSLRRPVRIRGKHWHFRGSFLTRSFDILNEASQVVMTHGKYWGVAGDCYGVDINDRENILLCLCLAVLIDCTVSGNCSAPVPAGG